MVVSQIDTLTVIVSVVHCLYCLSLVLNQFCSEISRGDSVSVGIIVKPNSEGFFTVLWMDSMESMFARCASNCAKQIKDFSSQLEEMLQDSETKDQPESKKRTPSTSEDPPASAVKKRERFSVQRAVQSFDTMCGSPSQDKSLKNKWKSYPKNKDRRVQSENVEEVLLREVSKQEVMLREVSNVKREAVDRFSWPGYPSSGLLGSL